MGTMTLAEMRDAVSWSLDSRQNVSDTQLDRWINWSYFHVSQPNIHRHTALEGDFEVPLVFDQIAYNLDTGVIPLGFPILGIYGVWHYKGASIGWPNFNEALQRTRLKGALDIRSVDTVAGVGPPTRYTTYNRLLRLDRRASTAEVGQFLRLRAYFQPQAMDTDADVTILETLWDEVICLGATWRGFRELGENARAEVARQNFGLLVQEQHDRRRTQAEDWGGGFEVELTQYMPT